jgi:hypothetical protein
MDDTLMAVFILARAASSLCARKFKEGFHGRLAA